jgi:DNA-binding MurR/RpiR family transcriptional regulator
MDNVFDTLISKYSSMTKTEKKIADFVLAHSVEIQYSAIASFAKDCGVGEASVFRFCKLMDLGGYNEFKLSIARALSKQENATDNAIDLPMALGKVTHQDQFSDLCKKLMNTQISALTQTIELADEASYSRAVQQISQSRRVLCVGQGHSLVMAMVAWSRFISISPNFIFVEDSHLQITCTSLLDKNDTLLFFSYSGATRDMLEIFKLAKDNGVTIILVTHYPDSPGARLADTVLLCGSNEGPLQVGSMAAKAAQLIVIDILFNKYWLLNDAENEKSLEKSASSIAKKLI